MSSPCERIRKHRAMRQVAAIVLAASPIIAVSTASATTPTEPPTETSDATTTTTTPPETTPSTEPPDTEPPATEPPDTTEPTETTEPSETSEPTSSSDAPEPTIAPDSTLPEDDFSGGIGILAVISNAITGVNIVESSVNNGNTSMRINVTWAVGPGVDLGGSVQGGDTFALQLDPQLRATNGTFNLTDAAGEVVATVTITGNRTATFTLTDYVNDRLFTTGSAFWTVRFADTETPAGIKNLQFTTDTGDVFTDAVEVRNQFVPAPPSPTPTTPSKSGSFTDAGQRRINWTVAGSTGPAGEMIIADHGQTEGPTWDVDCASARIDPTSVRPTATITCTPDGITATITDVPSGVRPILRFVGVVTDPSLSGDLVFVNTATVTTNGVARALRRTLTQTNGGQGQGPTRPRSPTVVQSTCVDNEETQPQVTLPLNGGGITYALTGTVAPGETVVVTAELSSGYTWEATLPAGWVRVDANTATFTVALADPECLEPVALAAPAIAHPVCLDGDLTVPDVTPVATDGVTFIQSGSETPGGTVTVTAALQPGYRFPDTLPEGWIDNGNGTASFVVTFAAPQCDEIVTLTPPTIVQTTCPGGVPSTPSVAANETDGVVFTQTGSETPGGEVTLTATLQPGFAFPTTMPAGWTNNGDGTATFTLILDNPVCDEIAKLTVPAIEYTVCLEGVPTDPSVTPNETDGIVFTQTGEETPGGTVIVTATIQDGFTFPAELPDGWVDNGDGTATYTITFDDPECDEVVTLTPPIVFQSTCIDNEVQQPSVTPNETDGIVFTQSGEASPGGTVVITATLQPDYQFPTTMPEGWTNNGDGTATFTVVLDLPECLEQVALAAPAVTDVACQSGALTTPTVTPLTSDGLAYAETGDEAPGGTVSVTASVEPGYRFPPTMPTGWVDNGDGTATFGTSFGEPPCPGEVTLVAPAVVDPSCDGDTVTAPSITPIETDGITYTETGSETPGGTVVITATLVERFRFAPELPPGWVDNGDGTATFTVTFPTPQCVSAAGGTLPQTR
jgi:hypothetical protein